jgi:hypothetical protein
MLNATTRTNACGLYARQTAAERSALCELNLRKKRQGERWASAGDESARDATTARRVAERRETIAIRACNITLESYGPGKGRKERARWNVWLERSNGGAGL